MIYYKFIDNFTIEVIAPDGEKFIWKTFFPTPLSYQHLIAQKLTHYHQKYFDDNIKETTGMGLSYWVNIRMNFDEGIGITGGKGSKDDERKFAREERIRIGKQIRELRKSKNIEAKELAELSNIDPANLSRIEQGRYSVGLDILSKLAFRLGARIDITDSSQPNYSK